VVFHGWSARFYLPSIHLYRPPPTGGAEARAAWPLAEVHPGVVCAGHARRQACERRARGELAGTPPEERGCGRSQSRAENSPAVRCAASLCCGICPQIQSGGTEGG
jgi:hypothetical protein